jgi:hypothetical protein
MYHPSPTRAEKRPSWRARSTWGTKRKGRFAILCSAKPQERNEMKLRQAPEEARSVAHLLCFCLRQKHNKLRFTSLPL